MLQLEPRALFSVTAPSNLLAAAGSNGGYPQITLNWSDNSSDETGFVIARSTDGQSFLNVASVGANANAYVDSGVVAGYTYYYEVAAANGTEMSAFSNIAIATAPAATVPTAPSNLSGTLNQGKKHSGLSAVITWQDNSNNETRFLLQRSTDGVNWTNWYVSGANGTAYTDTAVYSGRTYYYRVCAYNSAGNSAWSNVFVLRT